ncbi:MAG: hypothetical protein ACRELV_17495 [Longimicrobiales bacterium]
MIRSTTAATILLAALAACTAGNSDIDAPPMGDEPIRTGRQVYGFDGSNTITISATYTNDTGATVWLPRCGYEPPSWTLERQEDDAWVPAYAPVCLMVYAPPVAVEPGESVTHGLEVHGPDIDAEPRLREPIDGTYRLVYAINDADDPGQGGGPQPEALPTERRVSNGFRIER